MSRRLGQHFLINKIALRKIASSLELREGETIIEVGSGHGELTGELLRYPVKLIAIEKDPSLIVSLQKLAGGHPSLEIVAGDILKILPQLSQRMKATGYKLTGNIPYYLTGYLLRTVSELEHKPALIVFTLQKEAAQRITAQPPQMNKLAASIRFWAEPKIIDYLPRRYFKPRPLVDSAIICLRIKNYELKIKDGDKKNYYKLINIIFRQPRKTVANNLQGFNWPKAGLTGKERPQDLDLNTLIKISAILYG